MIAKTKRKQVATDKKKKQRELGEVGRRTKQDKESYGKQGSGG